MKKYRQIYSLVINSFSMIIISTSEEFSTLNLEKKLPIIPDTDLQINVYVDITVIDLVIPEHAMQETEWTIELKQNWTDESFMKYFGTQSSSRYMVVDCNTMEKGMWMPDTFISNAVTVKTHDKPTSNEVCRAYSDGTVIWSIRLNAAVNCPMGDYNFPFNSYVCTMSFQSYGYTIDQVMLKWSETYQPIRSKLSSSGNVYTMDKFEHFDRFVGSDFGSHSCLEAKFHLTRLYRMYLVQVYMPSGMLVVLSWLAFWIDRDAIAARVSLGSLCVVSIITQATGLLGILPYISGIRAIDVWEAACICMIFLAMMEFAAMHFMCRMKVKHEEYVKLCQEEKDNPSMDEAETSNKLTKLDTLPIRRRIGRYRHILGLRTNPANIDNVSRILFPLAFIIFNFIYWPYYIDS